MFRLEDECNARNCLLVAEVRVQPTNNRAPDQAGEPAGKNAGDGAFEPGVSFTDEPSEHEGTSELPSWLQDFGGVASEPVDARQPQATAPSEEHPATASRYEPVNQPVTQVQPPPPPAMSRSAEASDNPFGQLSDSGESGFFSEDDLPEWLRALSTDSNSAAPPSTAPAPAIAAPSVTPNAAIQIPAISRAWVTASDQQDVSPGANLLSSLVHVIDDRPDAVAAAPAVSAPAPQPSARAAVKPQAAAPVATEATRDSGRWSWTRMLAVAAIIILLLLIIIMLFGN